MDVSSAVGTDPVVVAVHANYISRTGTAVVVALSFTRALVVSLLIGNLASYMLRLMAYWLKALHVPQLVVASLVLGVLVGSLSWIAMPKANYHSR